jgi:hypothetical protein
LECKKKKLYLRKRETNLKSTIISQNTKIENYSLLLLELETRVGKGSDSPT